MSYNYGGEAGLSASPIAGEEDNMGAFGSKTIRMAFIRKVYGILSVQLIITFGFVLIMSLSEESKMWAQRNSWAMFLSFGFAIASLLVLSCCGSVRRQFPHNFICLGIFTLAEATMLGFVTAFYKTDIVLIAVVITAVVVVALTLFACQTKIDFTVCSGVAFVALIVFMVMGFVMMFIKIKILHVIYSGLGALLFSFFLVIDTQMIVGGTHRNQISPEEYIFAAITLYTDIINLFLYILQLLSAARD